MVKETGPQHKYVSSVFLRGLLIACGWCAVAGGVAGIFLPLVPTVPFLLLAVACFARSSAPFHAWLVEHNLLGPFVRDYLHGGGMPLRAKIVAIVMVWVSFLSTIILFAQGVWLRALLVTIAMGITVYLYVLPTAPRRS